MTIQEPRDAVAAAWWLDTAISLLLAGVALAVLGVVYGSAMVEVTASGCAAAAMPCAAVAIHMRRGQPPAR